MLKNITVADMKTGQKARITGILGGRGLLKKLEDMGIRSGGIVNKTSQQLGTGPVIIKIGSTQVALGRGMAMKIEVKLL